MMEDVKEGGTDGTRSTPPRSHDIYRAGKRRSASSATTIREGSSVSSSSNQSTFDETSILLGGVGTGRGATAGWLGGPGNPCSPRGPRSPCSPFSPCGPCSPCSPFSPCGPCGSSSLAISSCTTSRICCSDGAQPQINIVPAIRANAPYAVIRRNRLSKRCPLWLGLASLTQVAGHDVSHKGTRANRLMPCYSRRLTCSRVRGMLANTLGKRNQPIPAILIQTLGTPYRHSCEGRNPGVG